MIFSIADHIEQIVACTKTETRRKPSKSKLIVGRTYSIQPGRNKRGDPRGRILILERRTEGRIRDISEASAKAEGGYTPEEFEELYRGMYPGWLQRIVYVFKFVPTPEQVLVKEGS